MTKTESHQEDKAPLLSESPVGEQLLAQIIDAAVDAIVLIDEQGMVQSVNRAFVKLFGYCDEEAVGKKVNMLMPSPYAEEHDGYLSSYLATGRRKIIGIGREVVARRKDGSVFPIDLAVSEIIVGERRLFTGTIRDITRRKQSEAELESIYKELHNLAYMTSHELQEPVSIITSYLRLLSTRYRERLGPDADEFIDRCTTSATRIQGLIDDLWDYARVDIVEKQQREVVDLGQLVKTIATEFLSRAELKDATITCDDLPVVRCNERQMKALFRNLLNNAVQFCGKDPLVVSITGRQKDSLWILCFKDNGIGIDPAHHQDIFRVFHRLSTSSDANNSGMGLAICKKIVEHHGWRIWVESTPLQGATFIVAIPESSGLR